MSEFRKNYLPKSYNDSFWVVPDRFNQFFDSWFNEFQSPSTKMATKMVSDFSPQIEVKEDKTNYFVDVELPGIKPEEVDLNFKDKVLTIKGHRKSEKEEQSSDHKTHYTERFYGTFMRTIPFNDDVWEEKIAAEYKNGLLKVSLPKKPTDSPVNRKIDIKS